MSPPNQFSQSPHALRNRTKPTRTGAYRPVPTVNFPISAHLGSRHEKPHSIDWYWRLLTRTEPVPNPYQPVPCRDVSKKSQRNAPALQSGHQSSPPWCKPKVLPLHQSYDRQICSHIIAEALSLHLRCYTRCEELQAYAAHPNDHLVSP